MEKKDKNKESEKFKIKEIFTNKRYYAIANLIFYSSVILLLIVFVRTSPTTTDNDSLVDNQVVEKSIEGFESIKNKNFNFKYTVKTKTEEVIYEGKQRDTKILFVNALDKTEYFREGKIILEKKGEEYVWNNSLKNYFDFFDVELINNILQNSILEDGEYFISNKEFSNVVDFDMTDDSIYGVYIKLNKQNSVVTSIEFDFSEISDSVEAIVLEYNNYGLIEDFDIK